MSECGSKQTRPCTLPRGLQFALRVALPSLGHSLAPVKTDGYIVRAAQACVHELNNFEAMNAAKFLRNAKDKRGVDQASLRTGLAAKQRQHFALLASD